MHGLPGASLIHPRVLESADRLGAEFTAAEPFPHLVIDDFLAPGVAERLLAEFPGFEQGNFVGDDGQPGGKSTSDKVRQLGRPTARSTTRSGVRRSCRPCRG